MNEAGWRRLRRVRMQFIVLFIAWMPVMIAVLFLADLLLPRSIFGLAVFWVYTVYSVCVGVAWIRFGHSKCPECGEKLFEKRINSTISTQVGAMVGRRCANCGVIEPPQAERME